MTAIDAAREALELVVKWEGREVAWDTPRARDLNTVAAALRGLIEAAERVRSVVPCIECSGTGWLAAYQRDGSATADSCRGCGGSGLRAAVPSTTE